MYNNLQTNVKRLWYQFWNNFFKVMLKVVMNMPAVLALFGAFDILTTLWPFCIAQRVKIPSVKINTF